MIAFTNSFGGHLIIIKITYCVIKIIIHYIIFTIMNIKEYNIVIILVSIDIH